MAVGPLPPDPIYDAQLNAIAKQRDDQLAALSGARSRGLADYGYVEGPGGSLRFDVNNAFSKAALLKKLHDTERRHVGQQMGSGGQLYSGAYQNAQDLSNRNQLQAQDSLQKALSDFLARNTDAAREARTSYQTQAQVLGGERVNRIETNPLYSPVTTAPAASKQQAVTGAPGSPGGPKQSPAQKKAMTAALRSTRIAGKPVSYQQWQRGDLYRALIAGAKKKPKKKK